jgi:3-hydroxy-9,10-secoandrosta-1,3,5(10)-triene-9,17-dione monooxygenase reductase component
MSFTSREFRDALGLFATGIAVVTASGADGQLAGVTVNSFTSVSLDPPLVLVSLARTIRSFEIFAAAKHFAVSLLREEQRHLSTMFASTNADKFAGPHHRPGTLSCPIIHPNLVAFECETYARHDGGDHELLLGRVIRLEPAQMTPPRPLVYFRGQYRELSDEHIELAPFRLEGW